MKKRLALVLAVCLAVTGVGGALPEPALAKGRTVAAKPYRVAFVFQGLMTFVRVGLTPCGAAQELWVLLPAATDIKAISDLAINNDNNQFAMSGNAEHHTMLSFAAGEVMPVEGANSPTGINDQLHLWLDKRTTDEYAEVGLSDDGAPAENVTTSGFDDIPEVLDGAVPVHVCAGCLSADGPDDLPHSGTMPLALRMVFKHGETASMDYHEKYHWKYSGGDTVLKPLPAHVIVTSKQRLGPTKLTIGRKSMTPITLTIPAPKDGHTVLVWVRNAPYHEILDPNTLLPFHPDLDHFKLSYLLAPKASTNGASFDYDYASYQYPVLVPNSGINTGNGDPFCTSPSRMQP